MEKVERLIEIIADMAGGIYTNDLTEPAGSDTEEPVRDIAQALAPMVANVWARSPG